MYPLLAAAGISALLSFEYRSGIGLLVSTPLCGGLLTGIAFGSPAHGALAGLMLQVLFLGSLRVRGRAEPDLPAAGVLSAALFATLAPGAFGDPALEALILFWALLAGLLAAAAGALVQRWWEGAAAAVAARGIEAARSGRGAAAAAIHLGLSLAHALRGFVVIVVLLPPALALVRLLSTRLETLAAGSLVLLPLLVPCVGAGTLLRLYAGRFYLFCYGAGFMLAAVWFIFGGR